MDLAAAEYGAYHEDGVLGWGSINLTGLISPKRCGDRGSKGPNMVVCGEIVTRV
jgi:hypothetical protein